MKNVLNGDIIFTRIGTISKKQKQMAIKKVNVIFTYIHLTFF